MGNQLPVKNSADNLLPGHVRLLSSVADKSPPVGGQKSATTRTKVRHYADKSPPQGGIRSEVRLGSPLRRTKSAKESAWWRSPPSKVRGGPKVRRRTSLADTRTFLAGVSASPRRSRSDSAESGGTGSPADSAADWRSPTRRNFGRTPSGSARVRGGQKSATDIARRS